MPRGRPMRMKEQVSINGENVEAKAEQEPKQQSSEFKSFPPKERALAAPLVSEITTKDMFEIEDRKPVTGVFRMQNKKPGEHGMVRIGALRKYKGDPMTPWIFEHGKTYTIPKWIADWLNGGEANPEDKIKSPRCNIIKHNDQWSDLQNKRPLSSPHLSPMYSFTPVAKW